MQNSILEEITETIESLEMQIETGLFSDKAPDEYIVLTPMSDVFEHYADDFPGAELQEIRLSLFAKGNYLYRKNEIVQTLLNSDFTITDRRYIGYEADTGFHHFAIDVLKAYNLNS